MVYRNQVERGIAQAKAVFRQAKDVDLKFRAGSLLVNSYAINRDFTEGLRYLNQTLPMRHRVRDKDIRHDGIDSAAALYNQLGQYQLGLRYARETLADQPNPRALCGAGHFQIEAQYHLGQLPADDAPVLQAIERCVAAGDKLAPNFIRVDWPGNGLRGVKPTRRSACSRNTRPRSMRSATTG